ncbi:MAG: hypothetical protein QM760_22965 [Nibricoccus sp.]
MTTPPPLPKPRFNYPRLTFLLTGIGWAISLLLPVPDTSSDPGLAVGYRIGQGVAMIAFPVIITWALWKLARLRDSGVLATAWIVSGFFTVGTLYSAGSQVVQQRVTNNQQTKKMLADVKRSKAGLTPDSSAEERLDASHKAVESMNEAGEKMTGDDGRLMRAMAAAVQTFQRNSVSYYELLTEMQKNSVLSPENLTDSEEFDRRLARIDRFRAANEDMKKQTLNFEVFIQEAITKSGVSKSKQDATWQEFHGAFGSKKPAILKLRELDAEFADKMQAVVELLRDEFGKWNFSEGKILFESEDALSRYSQHLDRIRAIGEEEREIMQRLAL